MVYSQAYYFTQNVEDAKDITQDVLIKLWHNMDSISSKATKSWLLTVTKNLCIDFSRKKRELIESKMESDYDNGDFRLDGVDATSDPEQDMIQSDRKEMLMQAIGKLPEKIRHVVIMREIQDLKYEDIARAMEIPLNSVKVYLHRGRKMLFEYLKPYYKRG